VRRTRDADWQRELVPGAMLPYYFDVKGNGLVPSLCRLFYFMLQVLLLELTTDKFKLTLRRVAIYCTFFCLLPTIMIWNHIGLYLDDFLFPAWKDQEIHQPLFLVGNARSGTTWLHRLLTYDPSMTQSDHCNRFVTFKSWELVFAVSVTWRYLFHTLYAVDGLLGGWVYSALMFLEKQCVGHITVHPIGLMEAEEDEWVMVHIASAQLLLFFFPLGGSIINDLILFDTGNLSASTRRDVFHFYKQCVQRHMYYHTHYTHYTHCRPTPTGDPPKVPRFISKNPAFTLRLRTIYETFPDARVVCLLRDPVQSIPSMISYISKVWFSFACPVERYPSSSELLGFCEAHYLYPLTQMCAPRGENTWAFLSYHRLLEDLEGCVVGLLLRLYGETVGGAGDRDAGDAGDTWHTGDAGDAGGSAFREFLQSEQAKAGRYQTQHTHSIEQCCGGMSEAEVSTRIPPNTPQILPEYPPYTPQIPPPFHHPISVISVISTTSFHAAVYAIRSYPLFPFLSLLLPFLHIIQLRDKLSAVYRHHSGAF
jgi:hypothetical protein